MALTGLFTLGFSNDGPQPRLENTYQVIDNFSKVVGKHTIKAGFTTDRFQEYNPFLFYFSGDFNFAGGGPFSTGEAGADFLLGQPDNYLQANGAIINSRAREYYFYVQDEWKVRPTLTITYGTGWDVETPYLNLNYAGKDVTAWRPGVQSTVFPNAPVGVLWPGDPGINSAGGVGIPSHDLAPRLGFAWSPGGSKTWSIHAGAGIYYNRTEEELALQNLATAPYSLISAGVGGIGGSPSLAAPFQGWCAGTPPTACSTPQQFPYAPQFGPAASFTNLEPLPISVLSPHFGVPSSYNYNLTVERQMTSSMVLSVAYVGNVGRHLEADYELNPAGNAQGNPVAAAAGCSQYSLYACAPQTFALNPLIYPTITQQSTDFNSAYNSLQVSLNKQMSHGLSFLLAYTWSRYFDENSSADNQDAYVAPGVNPFGRRFMYGPSDNDSPQRFVFSYDYTLPFYHMVKRFRRVTDDWKLIGITTFQTGFPIRLANTNNPSLTCNAAFIEAIDDECWDRPALSGQPFNRGNPRTYSIVLPGQSTPTPNFLFNPAAFTQSPAGTFTGMVGRNAYLGPGLNNFDLSLMKDIHITESKYIELRLETYNTFNHTQFTPYSFQPSFDIGGVVSDINAPNFGQVVAANAARAVQLAGKIYF
jgi:hypothetical protein